MENQARLIRLPEVMKKTGFGKAWIYRLISQNRFPQPVKIGVRATAFVESEIDEWIDVILYLFSGRAFAIRLRDSFLNIGYGYI